MNLNYHCDVRLLAAILAMIPGLAAKLPADESEELFVGMVEPQGVAYVSLLVDLTDAALRSIRSVHVEFQSMDATQELEELTLRFEWQGDDTPHYTTQLTFPIQEDERCFAEVAADLRLILMEFFQQGNLPAEEDSRRQRLGAGSKQEASAG